MDEIQQNEANEKEQVYPKPKEGSRFIQEFFDRKVEDVLRLYETTAPVSHSGEKGAFRELLLRGVLASILPPHFGLGTGLVVDKWGRQSRQTDIIVFDRRVLPPVVFHEGHGLYPIDAVHRTIEVKSILKRAHVQEAEDAALLLHPKNTLGLRIADPGTLVQGQSYYPFSALFAFDAEFDITTKSIPEHMKRMPTTACRLICVAKKNFCSMLGQNVGADTPTKAMRIFTWLLLDRIEESAESRSKFVLSSWLGN